VASDKKKIRQIKAVRDYKPQLFHYSQCFFRKYNGKKMDQFHFQIPGFQSLSIYSEQKEFSKSYEGNKK